MTATVVNTTVVNSLNQVARSIGCPHDVDITGVVNHIRGIIISEVRRP